MATQPPMYELMYIINPVLNEEQTADIVKRVDAYLKDNGATIDQTQVIGSQRLAYPIEKKRNGYYATVNFTGPGEFIARLDRALRINDDIMRHLLLRYDAKMQRHYVAQKSAPAETAEAPAEA